MKKIIAIFIILLFVLVSLNNDKSDHVLMKHIDQNQFRSKDSGYDIILHDPVIMSSTYLAEQDYYIQIVLVKGSYHYDYLTAQQIFWDGEYLINLYRSTPDNSNLISETELEVDGSKNISFAGAFQLYTDDYNNDGNIDFTLGQRLGSDGSLYHIFTIETDGIISILPIAETNGIDTLYVASSNASIHLDKVGKDGFEYRYYEPEKGEYILQKRIWDGTEFDLVD